jgi:digeranylgeranylglycerophospholipid reductase
MNMRDTVVIGGGPAGSMAARLLAPDRDVLVIEEHSCSGEPVQCAGLLTDEVLSLSGVRTEVLNRIYGANVFFPGGGVITVRSKKPKVNVIDRAELDRLMAEKAMDAGAEYRYGERYLSHTVSNRISVKTDSGTEDCSLLIGADGHSSRTAMTLGDNRPREYIRGYQMDVRKTSGEEDMINIRLGSETAPGFFSWEVPFEDCIRVGLCTSWSAGPPWNYMKKLLAETGLDKAPAVKKYCGKIPLGGRPRSYGDRLMLIGDAAGQVKPVSAGGLHPAFKSAPFLKKTADEAFASDDFSAKVLSRYEKGWKKETGKELRRGYALRKAFKKMSDSDLDKAYGLATSDSVLNALNDIDFDRPSSVIENVPKRDLIRFLPFALKVIF